MCGHVCACVREDWSYSWLRDGQCGYWELNLSPLQGQCEPLTTYSSAPTYFLKQGLSLMSPNPQLG